MTRAVRLRPRARRDLRGIWRYSVERWSVAQADDYVRGLMSRIEDLRTSTDRSASSADIHPGLRRIKAGSHVIFFLLDERGVDVVRLLHEQMDFATRLAEELTPDD